MALININKVLPLNMAIDSIEDVLYSIGLCHQSVREGNERSAYNSPKLISFVLITDILMQIISFFTDDEIIHLMLNELSLGMGIASYVSVIIIILALMVLFSQSVYYWNHKRGIEPTFVRVFQVMSGSITPSSVGLTNERQVRQLLSIGKWIKPLMTNNKLLPPILTVPYIYINHLNINDRMTSYIIYPYNFLFTSFAAYYAQSILSIQLFLFYIICKYFKIKERCKKIDN